MYTVQISAYTCTLPRARDGYATKCAVAFIPFINHGYQSWVVTSGRSELTRLSLPNLDSLPLPNGGNMRSLALTVARSLPDLLRG